MTRFGAILLVLFSLALIPRLYGALTFGAGLDGPGTFQLINFDEGGSCRAFVGDFRYPTFMGRQVVAIASLLGWPPSEEVKGGPRAREYCQSARLIRLQRIYASVLGSLTCVLVAVMGMLLWPSRLDVAFTAGWLLAFSNFHVAESHWATADAPQVFFIVLFMTVLTWAIRAGSRWAVAASPILLVAAIWTKWWVFAVFSYLGVAYRMSSRRALASAAVVATVLAGVAVWSLGPADLIEIIERRRLLWGSDSSRFGSGYGQIGVWRRWIRNLVNVPVFHAVALGIPACLFVWPGLRTVWGDSGGRRLYLVHASIAAYLAYLIVLGPVTYYRYYLPLLPAAVLLGARGFWDSRYSKRPLWVALFLIYPVLMTIDSEFNFRNDPRRELREWMEDKRGKIFYVTYYVNPPPGIKAGLFRPGQYARLGKAYLRPADYLILSENWYDTAFANELNGPVAWKPEWLIKTRPVAARTYRRILSGEDPNLEPVASFEPRRVMPEFVLHRLFYGSFPLFVGDVNVFRVVEVGGRDR